MNLCLLFLVSFLLVNFPAKINAQHFLDNPETFGDELTSRLKTYRNIIIKDIDLIPPQWRALTPGEKNEAFQKAKLYAEKGAHPYPHIYQYLRTLFALKAGGSMVNISFNDFFFLTDTTIKALGAESTLKFLENLDQMARFPWYEVNKSYRWQFSNKQPEVRFIKAIDSAGQSMTVFPALYFPKTDINFHTGDYSSTLQGTSGYLNLLNFQFYGEGGRYDWARHKLDPQDIYVQLPKFLISLNVAQFTIDNAKLFYNSKFKKPVNGQLKEYFLRRDHSDYANYPYFRTVKDSVILENFVPQVDFMGGFAVQGNRTYGIAPVVLNFKNKNNLRVARMECPEVLVSEKKLVSNDTKYYIFLPTGDTIHHPSMQLIYNTEKKHIFLNNNPQTKGGSIPIQNTWLKFDMNFDALHWTLDSDTIYLSGNVGKEHKLFALESHDFFSYERFDGLRGVLPFNPIGIIYRRYLDNFNYQINQYKNKLKKSKEEASRVATSSEFDVGDSEFNSEDFTQDVEEEIYEEDLGLEQIKAKIKPTLGFTVNQILKKYKLQASKEAFKNVLPQLEQMGFIEYSPGPEYITIKEKLLQWGRAASHSKDFDVLYIPSQVKTNEPNAYIIISKGILHLNGVESFSFSDSQYVVARPSLQKIQVGRNREIQFTGIIEAGQILLESEGKPNYKFIYDDFKIICDSVHRLRFFPHGKVEPRLLKGIQKLEIENFDGALYIDKFNNKSGRKSTPDYSIFDCYTPSYVYWNDKNIQNGIYTRDKLYFVLDPFLIDSLENFSFTKLEFMGECFTSEIMPSFRDTLKLMADNTYGVSEVFPPEGVPIYNGKARFYNRITLDGLGLHGKGKIKYLSSIAESDTFIFHFDSVMAVTKSFYLPEGEFEGYEFPEIKVQQAYYTWYPKEQLIKLKTTHGDPIRLYKGNADFFGEVYITPKGVRGKGTFVVGREKFTTTNGYLNLNIDNFSMDDGIYAIQDSLDPTRLHFEGKHLSTSHVFATNMTMFRSVEGSKANISFPKIKYATSMQFGSYLKLNKEIHLETVPEDTTQNFFISTDSTQHKLKFNARGGIYKIDEQKLTATHVDSLYVADAVIYPFASTLRVQPNGMLEPLDSAKIICNRINRKHFLSDAHVEVLSGINYRAAANYRYPSKPKHQTIRFNEIFVKPDTTTYARAFLPEEQEFTLTERIYFKDTVELKANQPYLNFKGQAKIQSPNIGDKWFKIAEENVNPDSVIIRIDAQKLGKLRVGTYFSFDRAAIYTRFLEPKLNEKRDSTIMVAEGAITFDPTSREFRIGPLAKLKNQVLRGNVLSFNDEKNVVVAQGLFKLPYNCEEPEQKALFPLRLAGTIEENRNTEKIKSNLVLALKLPDAINPALNHFAERAIYLNYSAGDLLEIIDDKVLHLGLAEIIDNDKTQEKNIRHILDIVKEESPNLAQIQAAKFASTSILLTGVDFKYCNRKGREKGVEAILYATKPVGLLGINQTTLTKKVEAKIMYNIGNKLPSGKYNPDKVQIYLEFDEFEWIYFEFKNNELKTRAMYNKYNDDIQNIANKLNKKKKLILKLATENEINEFRQKVSQLVLSGCE
ncbi:MAG: hypothetical protein RML72_06140 [Bacteroidia bacterium]|nr:hypothetical protein [Bacteroidia bacterium]MDW8158440.1 hypothetical protein [Bacteroidia bacterium]